MLYILVACLWANTLPAQSDSSWLRIISDIDCQGVLRLGNSSDSLPIKLIAAEEKLLQVPTGKYSLTARLEVNILQETFVGETTAKKTTVVVVALYQQYKELKARMEMEQSIDDKKVNEIKYQLYLRQGNEFLEWGDNANALKYFLKARALNIHIAEIELKIAQIGGSQSTTEGTLIDPADGQTYTTTKIGNQIWMAENLRYDMEGAYLNEQSPSAKYGFLYTFDAAQKACPGGWRLPKVEDWELLLDVVGEMPATKLRSPLGWARGKHLNTFGWSALPAGWYDSFNGVFGNLGEYTGFWTSTAAGAQAYYYGTYDKDVNISRHVEDRNYALSVRCIKN